MLEIADRFITDPGQLAGPYNGNDGIGIAVPGEFLHVRDSTIDFSGLPLGKKYQDEAAAVTWGASALFERCIIRGAGKLLLSGSGDRGKRPDEAGCRVTLRECLLEDFGRRGPEVQCGMSCEMVDTVVRGWGHPDRFDCRAFGAWAHDGGFIVAKHCAFINEQRLSRWQALVDHWHHFWQALKDNGPRAIVDPLTYAAGWRRGLTASDTGQVLAFHCYASPGVIVHASIGAMTEQEASELVNYIGSVAGVKGESNV